MLIVGYSKKIRIDRSVEDKMFGLLPQPPNLHAFNGHYRESEESKHIEKEILQNLREESSEFTNNQIVDDSIKGIIVILTGSLLSIVTTILVWWKCCQTKRNEQDEVRLRQMRNRPASLVKTKTE